MTRVQVSRSDQISRQLLSRLSASRPASSQVIGDVRLLPQFTCKIHMQNGFYIYKKILSEIKKTLYFFFCQPFRPFSRRAWFIMNWWPTTATCSGCQDPSLNWFRTCCWPTSMWSQPRSQTAGMLPRFPPRRSMVSSMAEGPSMTRAL